MLVGIFLCWVNFRREKTYINFTVACREKIGLKIWDVHSLWRLKVAWLRCRNTRISVKDQLWYMTTLSYCCSGILSTT
jgi:hypothetical protein